MTPATEPFRVIIAGGSQVGLTLALALERAGIDYTLLEKREIAPHTGASISIHPHIQRVLEQLEVWPEIEAGIVPLEDRKHYDEHGTMFEDSSVLQEISKMCDGRHSTFMERKFMHSCIYDKIKDKARIHTHSRVASFVETSDRVEVTTEDGRVFTGDILIGADGVHSTVRTLLTGNLASIDRAAAKQMEDCFKSSYHCIFATSRDLNAIGKPFLPERMVQNVYYPGFSGAAATSVPGLVFWFLFVKSDQVTTGPNIPRFNQDQAEATIARYGDYAVGEGYTFRDLWESRVKGGMVALEEGVLPTKWNSGGRVVLVGDSVHKATINPGLGGNLAVEGVVHLLNGLVPLVCRSPADGREKSTVAELTAVFDEYERKQRPHAKFIVSFSGYLTRYDSMETWWLRAARRISPWISDRAKAGGFARYIKQAPFLEFLPNPDEQPAR